MDFRQINDAIDGAASISRYSVPRHALRHLTVRRDLSSIVITNEARTGFATEKVLLRGTL